MAAIANFLLGYHANILHADQHQDAEQRLFLIRLEWDLAGFTLPLSDFAEYFAPIADRYQMKWRVAETARRARIAVFVSHKDHCLADLLYRQHSGGLGGQIVALVSNHHEAAIWGERYHIPFHYLPVEAGQKEAAEARQLAVLAEAAVDLVVLARYMQILSPGFIAQFPGAIINIHHSFLPAFEGARPYHRAYDRGVKLIGATAHYVTETLDDGPIIEQDVVRISHRDDLSDLLIKGADLERMVLSRAVRWHLEHRILTYTHKTVVFD